jgi:hypothetical protein
MVRAKGQRKRNCSDSGCAPVTLYRFKSIHEVVADDTQSLNIDKNIGRLSASKKSPRLQSIWAGRLKDAELFGRRTLDVAGHLAQAAGAKDLSLEIASLERMSKLATEASSKATKLLQNIVRDQYGNTRFTDAEGKTVPLSTLAVYPIHFMYYRDALNDGLTPDPQLTRSKAKNHSETISAAIDALHGLASYAVKRRDMLAAGFQNPGAPQKLEFVRQMLEGWIYLTGQNPSENATRFSEFLTDGWLDICEVDAGDWRHSIRTARAGLNPTAAEILRSAGPSWR